MRYIIIGHAVREDNGWSPRGGLLKDSYTGKVAFINPPDGVEVPPWIPPKTKTAEQRDALWRYASDTRGNGITESWSFMHAYELRDTAVAALHGDAEAARLGTVVKR